MSEKLHSSPESQRENNLEAQKHQEKLLKTIEKKSKSSRHEHSEKIGEIRASIEAAAKAKQEQQNNLKQEKEPERPSRVSKELKDLAYRRTLRRAQNRMSAPSRLFSRAIHQPAVEAVSELAGKTVARPSGVLLGGIFAFLGSGIFLWVTRHYGYEYNYLLFAICFVGGYFVGLFVELGLKMASRKSR